MFEAFGYVGGSTLPSLKLCYRNASDVELGPSVILRQEPLCVLRCCRHYSATL